MDITLAKEKNKAYNKACLSFGFKSIFIYVRDRGGSYLSQQFVAQDREGRHSRPVVWNGGPVDEPAASELEKVLARVYPSVHVLHDLGGCSDAPRGHADTLVLVLRRGESGGALSRPRRGSIQSLARAQPKKLSFVDDPRKGQSQARTDKQ